MKKEQPKVNFEALKKQYAILKGEGLQQKEIAKKLGVSEKTVSHWKNTLAISHYFTIQAGIQKRLMAMVKDKNTPATDIYNISNSLCAIEKLIKRT